jgi:hypothetical protein
MRSSFLAAARVVLTMETDANANEKAATSSGADSAKEDSCLRYQSICPRRSGKEENATETINNRVNA